MFSSKWHGIRGNALGLGLGYGKYHRSWFLTWEITYLMGPYAQVPGQDEQIVTQGTAATVWAGLASGESDLRALNGQMGMLIGLSYEDMESRAVEPDPEFEAPIPSGTDHRFYRSNYQMNSDFLLLLPGFFYGRMEPQRPSGDRESSLATRIEGYRVAVYLSIPLYVRYVARHQLHDLSSQEQASSPTRVTDKGLLYGHTFHVSVTFLLGV